jgi:hypothetical protein
MEMSNNKQLTAVEWLVCQLQQTRDWQRVINEANQSTTSVRNVLEQSKERDKEQKLNMFNCGRQYQVTGEGTFKQVYQEIYGGNNDKD